MPIKQIKFFLSSLYLSIAFIAGSYAEVRLPKIFTSNMVLQRDRELKIWGWADANEKVTVSFNSQTLTTKAAKNGEWIVLLKPMAYGGPFDMSVKGGKNNISLTNILIGDVWICSGQSNMEWLLKNVNNANKEIGESTYPRIRLFTVKKATSYEPVADLAGGEWLECNPANSGNSSAVAYFFGRQLAKDINVPIGLLNSSWGGTNIQTWISWDSMSQKEKYKNADLNALNQSLEQGKKNAENYRLAIANDIGSREKWYDPFVNIDGWKTMTIPQVWETGGVGNADGVVWFRKEFNLNGPFTQNPLTLSLGVIDDLDSTYINGVLIGTERLNTKERVYTVNSSVFKEGKNVITIKVTDFGGSGGIKGNAENMFCELNGQKTFLAGNWQYKPSALSTDFEPRYGGPNSFPSQLYNAMIYPIIRYGIKGGIWYQGESNAGEAYNYRSLFPEMINDWRAKWGYPFPFCWVQLANYMAKDNEPVQSEWAELREAQNMTLSLPATGQAVIIDIGETNDIHPRNKQDVGYRLALAAEKAAYGKDIVYSGPIYRSMEVSGNKAVLSFTSIGSGLIAKNKYGNLEGFAIAGDDQKFVWAKASIEGDKIVVYCDAVTKPVAVRYGWGNNPDANLFNKEGIPASPFRTDNWKGITEGK